VTWATACRDDLSAVLRASMSRVNCVARLIG
jgi:hypothetical protein